ncbi:kinase-like domain-containing protein [Earliella scabrosa]|nr:kinase-like domain-containing protein [Earliella scabrosa]
MAPPSDGPPNAEDPLPEREVYWRDRYEWLCGKGYQLRPRYKPGWTPSWHGTKKTEFECEDGVEIETFKILDAVRIQDGSTVMLKQIDKTVHPHESAIGLHMSLPELASDPRNHCCPVLEVLQDPFNHDLELMVMPLLRLFDEPKLATVGEAAEFFRQTFEGLRFMHEHHVAHRDISKLNIMMDPRPILPNGFHPQAPYMSRDLTRFVSPRSRTRYPVKYYFTDFGHARRYASEETNPLERPLLGGDKTVPEFQNDRTTPRNPFHTDVYYMGNIVRRYFLQVYSNLAFMSDLIARMVQDEPDKRPTMDEVLKEYKSIMTRLPSWKLRERLVERRDSPVVNFFKDVHHISFRTVPFMLTFRSPLPTPKTTKSKRRS